jgi:flagellar motor switch protein FliN/FliY
MTDTPGHVDGESRAVGAAARDTFPALEDFDVPATDAPMATAAAQGLEALYDVPVRVLAVLGRSRIPIGELLQLKVGAVLELDRRVGEPVDIFVNNRLIARGEVVLIESSLGVTLTEIVRVNQ